MVRDLAAGAVRAVRQHVPVILLALTIAVIVALTIAAVLSPLPQGCHMTLLAAKILVVLCDHAVVP